MIRFSTLGVGALASPRYAPAGLLVEFGGGSRQTVRVMIDGGPGASPRGRVDAWLTTDPAGELMPAIRRLARAQGLTADIGPFRQDGLVITCKPVRHTNHPSYGCLISIPGRYVVWAPEFYVFPRWARNADLMFAEASAWNRPIRFVGGVGGHMAVLAVGRRAASQPSNGSSLRILDARRSGRWTAGRSRRLESSPATARYFS